MLLVILLIILSLPLQTLAVVNVDAIKHGYGEAQGPFKYSTGSQDTGWLVETWVANTKDGKFDTSKSLVNQGALVAKTYFVNAIGKSTNPQVPLISHTSSIMFSDVNAEAEAALSQGMDVNGFARIGQLNKTDLIGIVDNSGYKYMPDPTSGAVTPEVMKHIFEPSNEAEFGKVFEMIISHSTKGGSPTTIKAAFFNRVKVAMSSDVKSKLKNPNKVEELYPWNPECPVEYAFVITPLVYVRSNGVPSVSGFTPEKWAGVHELMRVNTYSRVVGIMMKQMLSASDLNAYAVAMQKLIGFGEMLNFANMSHLTLPDSAFLSENTLGFGPPPGTSKPHPFLNGQYWKDSYAATYGGFLVTHTLATNTPKPAVPCCNPVGFDKSKWDGKTCPCIPGLPIKDCHCPPNCSCDPSNPPPGCDCINPPKQNVTLPPLVIKEHEVMASLKYQPKTTDSNSFSVEHPNTPSGWTVGTSCDSEEVEHGGYSIIETSLGKYETIDESYSDTHYDCSGDDYAYKTTYGNDLVASVDKAIWSDFRFVKNTNSLSKAYDIMRQGNTAQIDIKSNSLNREYSGPGGVRNPGNWGNPFSEAPTIDFVSHRFAGKEDTLVLAKYMDKNNQRYTNYLKDSGVPNPKAATNGATHSYDLNPKTFRAGIGLGGNARKVTFHQTITQMPFVRGAASGGGCGTHAYWCSVTDVPQMFTQEPLAVYARRIDYSVDVGVEGTYVGSPIEFKPVTNGNTKGATVTPKLKYDDISAEVVLFDKTSPQFEFYPTYAMSADYTAGNADEDEAVWFLGKNKRTFQGIDRLMIENINAKPTMDAPWSRDKQDREASMPVAKSGSAYKFKSTDNLVKVTAFVHLIDPAFAPDPAKADALNQQQISYAETSLSNIANAFGQPNAVAVYSNVTGASTLNSSVKFSHAKVDPSKDTLKLINSAHSSSGISKAYRYIPGVNGGQTSSRTFNGSSISSADLSGLAAHSNQRLVEQLEQDGGDKTKWYNEDFEGIILAAFSITLSAPTVETDYATMFLHQSDSHTKLNTTAPAVTNPTIGTTIIPGKSGFVTGVEFDLGQVTWGTHSQPVRVLLNPHLHGIRGSIFDTVQ